MQHFLSLPLMTTQLKSDGQRGKDGVTRQQVTLLDSPVQSTELLLRHSGMLISHFMMLLTTVQLQLCQMVHEEVNAAVAPAPTLSVLQAKEEYFLGESVTLVCTTPANITGKRLYQLFGEAGWALSEFSWRNNYTYTFTLSQMQHKGPHLCTYTLQKAQRSFKSPPSEELMISIADHLPQPLLMVESPLGEVMKGDLLRIICKAPGNATERRFHFYRNGEEVAPRKVGSENNISEREGILKNAMVLHFLHAGPQHSGNFTCKYEEKMQERWIPSLTSQAINITINSNKRGNSCFLILRLLVVGGCFFTINSLILVFFWMWVKDKDSSLQFEARLLGTSQTACRSLSTLQLQPSPQHHK